MTDETPPPGGEERLPARRPPVEAAPAERFTSPPSTRRFLLSPERAASIVRQSANARFVGFLAVSAVVLFLILYYFYELGFPAGLSQSRLTAEADAQQITSIERGYNLFEANCARCHGTNGEGGIGPVLHDQSKLYTHLSEQYIHNVLTVGGRYVCGDPNSLMPVWSNDNGGPLNYKQIEDIINFIRAPKGPEYQVRDPSLFEPTGQTFEGWRDTSYTPPPDATPFPDCWKDAFKNQGAAPSGSAGASGSPSTSAAPAGGAGASGNPAPSGQVGGSPVPASGQVQITAQGIAFTTQSVEAPAGTAFSILFDNQDNGIPHNVDVQDSSGTSVFKGEIVTGVTQTTYNVPALAAGSYTFICDVHPNMTGTLTVK